MGLYFSIVLGVTIRVAHQLTHGYITWDYIIVVTMVVPVNNIHNPAAAAGKPGNKTRNIRETKMLF